MTTMWFAIAMLTSAMCGHLLSRLMCGYSTTFQVQHVQENMLPLRARSNNAVFGNALALCPGNMGASTLHVEELLKLQKPGLAIDVGAHDASDAIAYAEAGHTVLSYEPSPSKSLYIERKLSSISKDVASKIAFKAIGLSEQKGLVSFYVGSDKNNLGYTGGRGSQQDMMDPPPWSGFRKVRVPVDTLDNEIGNRTVTWLKIDAQGHDGKVLLGARKAISEHRIEALSFEMAPKLSKEPDTYVEAVQFLNKSGYICHDCRFFKIGGMRGKTSHVQQISIEKLISNILGASTGPGGKYTEIVCYYVGG